MPLTRRVFLTASGLAPLLAAETHTVETPAQLAAVARAARPSDTILLRDGEWRDADLTFTANGEKDAPVVVRAQTPGAVTLTGRSRLRFSGSWVRVEGLMFRDCLLGGDLIQFRTSTAAQASDCVLAECAVIDSASADPEASIRWVSLYGFRNRVTRCYFRGKKDLGTLLVVWLTGEEPNYHRIDANHFGPRPPLGQNGAEIIRVGDSATSMRVSRTLVEENLFDRCDGETETISNKSCENGYWANVFERCQGTLTLRHGDRCHVEGNWFFGHGLRNTGGIRVIGERHTVVNNYLEGIAGTDFRAAISITNGLPESPLNGYFQVKDAVVAFNTMLDCTEPLRVGSTGGNRALVLEPLECVIANNVSNRDGYERAEDGLLRPLEPVAGEGEFSQVTKDIDGQARGEVKHAGCDQVSTEERQRRRPTMQTTGPAWLRTEDRVG